MDSIKIINPAEVFPVRKEVLRKGIPLPFEFSGDYDATTTHFGYFVDDQLVSVATVLQSSHPFFTGNQFQLRGMATLVEHQGKGLGSLLVKKIEKYILHKNAEIMWFNARVKALNFYQKLGFKTIGEEFELPHVGMHYVMFKEYNS